MHIACARWFIDRCQCYSIWIKTVAITSHLNNAKEQTSVISFCLYFFFFPSLYLYLLFLPRWTVREVGLWFTVWQELVVQLLSAWHISWNTVGCHWTRHLDISEYVYFAQTSPLLCILVYTKMEALFLFIFTIQYR